LDDAAEVLRAVVSGLEKANVKADLDLWRKDLGGVLVGHSSIRVWAAQDKNQFDPVAKVRVKVKLGKAEEWVFSLSDQPIPKDKKPSDESGEAGASGDGGKALSSTKKTTTKP
jgi:hypothetical protein